MLEVTQGLLRSALVNDCKSKIRENMCDVLCCLFSVKGT